MSLSKRKQIYLLYILWLIILAAMVGSGILVRPLSYDEQLYYLPILEHFSQFSLGYILDYPFPAPPLGIMLQSGVYFLADKSWLAVRLGSFIALLLLSFYILRRDSRRQCRSSAVISIMILSFPFLLHHAFTLRQHMYAVLFLVMGSFRFAPTDTEKKDKNFFLQSFFLASALLINQMTMAYVGAKLCSVIVAKKFGGRGVNYKELGVCISALTPLVVLMFLWKGTTPPSFLSIAYTNAESFSYKPVLKHLVLITSSFGIWIAPLLYCTGKYAIRRGALFMLYLLSVGIIIASKGYSPNSNFYLSIVGPASTVTSFISEQLTSSATYSLMLQSMLLAVPMCFGLSLLLKLKRDEPYQLFILLYALVYFVMMLFVPHFFEGYYMYFLIMTLWTIKDGITKEPLNKKLFFTFATFVILFGLTYVNITLFLRR